MEESFLFLLLSYALTPTLSQRERAITYKILGHCVLLGGNDDKFNVLNFAPAPT